MNVNVERFKRIAKEFNKYDLDSLLEKGIKRVTNTVGRFVEDNHFACTSSGVEVEPEVKNEIRLDKYFEDLASKVKLLELRDTKWDSIIVDSKEDIKGIYDYKNELRRLKDTNDYFKDWNSKFEDIRYILIQGPTEFQELFRFYSNKTPVATRVSEYGNREVMLLFKTTSNHFKDKVILKDGRDKILISVVDSLVSEELKDKCIELTDEHIDVLEGRAYRREDWNWNTSFK